MLGIYNGEEMATDRDRCRGVVVVTKDPGMVNMKSKKCILNAYSFVIFFFFFET